MLTYFFSKYFEYFSSKTKLAKNNIKVVKHNTNVAIIKVKRRQRKAMHQKFLKHTTFRNVTIIYHVPSKHELKERIEWNSMMLSLIYATFDRIIFSPQRPTT